MLFITQAVAEVLKQNSAHTASATQAVVEALNHNSIHKATVTCTVVEALVSRYGVRSDGAGSATFAAVLGVSGPGPSMRVYFWG